MAEHEHLFLQIEEQNKVTKLYPALARWLPEEMLNFVRDHCDPNCTHSLVMTALATIDRLQNAL